MTSQTSDHSSLRQRAEIERLATEFVQRRRFGDWTSQDEAALDLWLNESTAQRVVYLRMQSVAARAERLASLRRAPSQLRTVDRVETGPLRRLMFPILAGAASLVLIAALGVGAFNYLMRPSERSFATDVGGRATLKFSDGTQIELNTNTALRYRMTTSQRLVWLDRGEAYFRVAHDVTHPFIVVAGGQRITDLGTEFLVRSDATSHVEVALIQGRAQLSSDDGRTESKILKPGDDAVASDNAFSISHKTPQQMADELAWQHGVVVFRDARLADAVQQFNRYNQTQLEISDPRVGTLRIGGEFKTNDLAEFLELVQLALKVRAERRGDEIWLTRADVETNGTKRDALVP